MDVGSAGPCSGMRMTAWGDNRLFLIVVRNGVTHMHACMRACTHHYTHTQIPCFRISALEDTFVTNDSNSHFNLKE